MHKSAVNLSREEIVKQVREGKDSSLRDWTSYIPIGKSVQKMNTWNRQDTQILYLTSRIRHVEVMIIKNLLEKHGFPEGLLLHRENNETYKDVAEKAMPDLIIEDDCESIGGKSQMTYTHLGPELKRRVSHIVVKEFEGIDHLPDRIYELAGER